MSSARGILSAGLYGSIGHLGKLEKSDLRDCSLYIHVPFCRARCDYCSFHSSIPQTAVEFDNYLGDIFRVLSSLPKLYPGISIPSVYIGGGTPSFLPKAVLIRLLEAIQHLLIVTRSTCREWTLEVNPADMDIALLELLRSSPVDRLSLGVQSFSPQVRCTLGRRDPVDPYMAIQFLRSNWNRRISADLIHGVPGQTDCHIHQDLECIKKLGLEHLSWYGLTIEEGTPLSARFGSDTVLDGDDDPSDLILPSLRDCGLDRYEISNFAVPGQESIHNLRYWSLDPWLGIGPGAVSMIPGSDGNPVRFRFDDDTRETILPLELFKEFFMLGLRTARGVSWDRLESVFGFAPKDFLSEYLQRHNQYFINNEHTLSLTDRGIDISNILITDLFRVVESKPFPARNVSWPIYSLD